MSIAVWYINVQGKFAKFATLSRSLPCEGYWPTSGQE